MTMTSAAFFLSCQWVLMRISAGWAGFIGLNRLRCILLTLQFDNLLL